MVLYDIPQLLELHKLCSRMVNTDNTKYNQTDIITVCVKPTIKMLRGEGLLGISDNRINIFG